MLDYNESFKCILLQSIYFAYCINKNKYKSSQFNENIQSGALDLKIYHVSKIVKEHLAPVV